MPTALRDVPKQVQSLYDHGIKSVIPLFKGKSPGYADWNKITEEESQEKFWGWTEGDKPVNYGIRLGKDFGDVCDIDLDSNESRRLAKYYLPATAMFGRGGAVTHYLYRQIGKTGKEGSSRFQWDKRDEKSVLLELRASGQTMGPGSVHPVTGEAIEWMSERGVGLHEIEGVDLGKRVRMLAAASLLLRDWQSGGRDELAVCLIGSMIRGEWDCGDIDAFIAPILSESGDEESKGRFKADRLAEELKNGGRVPGLKRLRELCSGGGLGAAGFDRIVEWLELAGGDIIEEINGEFAVVTLPGGGGVSVMREAVDGVSFLDRQSFGLLYGNRSVRVGGRDVTADKFWIAHKDRREYLKGVVFKPGQEVQGGEYNLWRGFSVEEKEGGDWSLFKEHILRETCCGNQEYYTWLIGWMAHRVQRPWEVPESCVVLIGERGDGKGTFFKIFGRLFGRHYMTVTQSSHLVGKFNKHLADKVLVFADEAVWGGNKESEGVLKTMISEDSRVIEIKGKDAFTVRNCTAYGIASNNDWVVPVGRHERRFLILHSTGRYRGDLEYFDRLYSAMSEREADGVDGLAGMLWDLRRVDISGWRGNKPPRTGASVGQLIQGMETWVQYLVEWAQTLGDKWDCREWRSVHYAGYASFMERQGHRHPAVIAEYYKKFKRVFGDIETVKRNRFVENGGGYTGGRENREPIMVFPGNASWIRERINTFCGVDVFIDT